MNGDETREERANHCCKVGRVADRYGLDEFDETLADRWTATEDRVSLRELTHEFNQRLVRGAMQAASLRTLDGEAENTYRLLTDDEVSSGMRTRARNRLARDGIDPDELESAFVSHQTLHTHFTDCLGVRLDTERDDLLDTERTKVNALRNRMAVVTTDSLERLHAADEMTLESFDVLVDVSVYCKSCGAIHDLDTVFDQGGCDCQAHEG